MVQDRTAIGKLLSAPVIALLLGLGGAAAGLLPTQCVAYDAVWEYVMPIAAALLLLESDLRGCAARLQHTPVGVFTQATSS